MACLLLDLFLQELRPTLYRFLDYNSLSALSATCTAFYGDLVKRQSGPLYIPPHWRRSLASEKWCNIYSAKAARDVVKDLHQAAFFTGLGGATSKLKLRIQWSGSAYALARSFVVTVGIPGSGKEEEASAPIWLPAWKYERVAVITISDRPQGPVRYDWKCVASPVIDDAMRTRFRDSVRKCHEEQVFQAKIARAIPHEAIKALADAKKELNSLNAELQSLTGYVNRHTHAPGGLNANDLSRLEEMSAVAAKIKPAMLRVRECEAEIDRCTQEVQTALEQQPAKKPRKK